MTRYYRKSRRSRLSRSAGKLLPSIALVLVGSAGFYMAMQWFRGDAEETPVLAATEGVEEVNGVEGVSSNPDNRIPTTASPILQISESSAPLVSAFDGQHTGKIQRYLAKNSADMVVLAYLPTLDMATDSYHVWLLKDGLADVKDMGQLAPRADSSWVLNFTAGPASGIADPTVYETAVIMKEPNDDNPAPSGNRIAEAKF